MGRTTPQGPGHARQGTVRTVFRVLGIVGMAVGLVLAVTGFAAFVESMGWESTEPPVEAFVRFAAGGALLVVSVGLVNLGFAGASARYAAGEYAPAAKDTASYLTDGRGLLNVGATSRAHAGLPGGGAPCRSCGTGNDVAARYCDSCGTPLG